jgi:hypothetical protein
MEYSIRSRWNSYNTIKPYINLQRNSRNFLYIKMDISNSPCTASTSEVVITFSSPTTAAAGPDQTGAATCGLTSATLAANAPRWAQVHGVSYPEQEAP